MQTKKQNKIFYFLVTAVLLAVVTISYLVFIVDKDYEVLAEVSCDHVTENCFARENDDGGHDYYKIIYKNAGEVNDCYNSELKNGCLPELSCIEGEHDCYYEYCTEEALYEGEWCE